MAMQCEVWLGDGMDGVMGDLVKLKSNMDMEMKKDRFREKFDFGQLFD